MDLRRRDAAGSKMPAGANDSWCVDAESSGESRRMADAVKRLRTRVIEWEVQSASRLRRPVDRGRTAGRRADRNCGEQTANGHRRPIRTAPVREP